MLPAWSKQARVFRMTTGQKTEQIFNASQFASLWEILGWSYGA